MSIGYTEKRATKPKSDKELYKLSNIKTHINKERRRDELDRLREVMDQKRTWNRTILFCGLLNLLFLILAFVGIK